MAIRKDTLWERFPSPVIRGLLDKGQTIAVRDRIDWQDTIDRDRPSAFVYLEF